MGFSGGASGKELPANAGEASLIPGSGGSLGVGNDNPLQYSCLGKPWTVEPGGLQSGVGGVTKESDMTQRSHTHKYTQ